MHRASFLLLSILLVCTASAAPSVSFLSIPSQNSTQNWVSGIVENAQPANYVVVLYIKVDGRWWGPKPTWAEPLTPIRSDRFWNATFVSNPNDFNATRFAAFLIPKSNVGPDMPPDVTGTASLPASLHIYNSSQQGRAIPVFRKVPSFGRNGTSLVGLSFGPYLNGERPGVTNLTGTVLRKRLAVIQNDTTWVRSYGTDGGLENFSTIAHSLGMRNAAGAWLTNDTGANLRALNALIKIGRSKNADVLIVGSETLLRKDLSDRELVTYIQWIRRETNYSVPVGTADSWGEFTDHPAVVEASDLLLIHIYPFWDKVRIDTAVNQTIEKYKAVVKKAGGRQVVIAELGWPDAGNANGAAVPGRDNAVRYFREMSLTLNKQNIPYFYFSAFDEAWKTGEGGVGPHWGLRYGNLTLKPGRLPLYSPDRIGVFRPSIHQFILKNGTTATNISWGINTDVPVAGDWNGDGLADVGVFRPSIHRFILKNGTTATNISWGISTDVPVAGDWNGDGRADVGVFRPSIHRFILKNGTTATNISWGISTDVPVAGDWNGDGLADVGVFRPSIHRFILKNGTTATNISWGISTDVPVAGDWNGDGLADVGVFRPSIHRFILKNASAVTNVSWGISTDRPVIGKWS